MKPIPISISPHACSEAEMKALSLWNASFLPLCQIWAAKRGLHPPADVMETLQKVRLEEPSISATMLDPLIRVPANDAPNESYSAYDSPLEDLITDLSHDLWQYQVLASHVDPPDHTRRFLTASRDLRRFQRAMSQLQLTHVEVAASEPMIVTLFSLPRATLYIPQWLTNTIPRTLFEPNQSFYRVRAASLAWLLFDAVVLVNANEFKWFDLISIASAR